MLNSIVKVLIHLILLTYGCNALTYSMDNDFKSSPADEKHQRKDKVHGHFKSSVTHTSRTTMYSSDDTKTDPNDDQGVKTEQTSHESTSFCSVDEQFKETLARLHELEERLEEKDTRRYEHDRFIGFSVYLSRSMPMRYEHIVKYDVIEINDGSGYDVFTGKFTVPVSGYYTISFYISSDDTRNCYTRLLIDGRPKLTSGRTDWSVPQNCDRGKSGVLKLFQGQKIWVETNVNKVVGGYDDHVTTFSGALLHRL
ncbi:Complement C1q subcomponent subunit B [Mactra antiquata]